MRRDKLKRRKRRIERWMKKEEVEDRDENESRKRKVKE